MPMSDADSCAVYKCLSLASDELLFKLNQNHGPDGKFTTGDGASTEAPPQGRLSRAVAAAHTRLAAIEDHAIALGQKAVGFARTSKVTSVNPVNDGKSLQFEVQHQTQSGTLTSRVQLQPQHVQAIPGGHHALAVANSALSAYGRPQVDPIPGIHSSVPYVTVAGSYRGRNSNLKKSLDPVYLGRIGVSGAIYR